MRRTLTARLLGSRHAPSNGSAHGLADRTRLRAARRRGRASSRRCSLRHDPAQAGSVPRRPARRRHWFGLDQLGRDVFSRLVARHPLVADRSASARPARPGRRRDPRLARGDLPARRRRGGHAVPRRRHGVPRHRARRRARHRLRQQHARADLSRSRSSSCRSIARVVRANVLVQYGEDYVAAERVIGARRRTSSAARRCVNCAAPVLVFCTVMVADAIVFEASPVLHRRGRRAPGARPRGARVIAFGKDDGADRRLVGHVLPRPAHPAHRARAEHPRPRASPTPGPPRRRGVPPRPPRPATRRRQAAARLR